ncbi:MAG: FCD domain-containing protein [Sphingobium sp.]|uniref:FadR/GntR family transcriptional regulator n=1 Tax=Sphingobium sp. TaxID=1912891 RepID=UPI0029BF0D31|nr:FCD domain-containing protein [Sphingobium sp.]MDX3910320.1 FCD domain-containing protein [Sphingobium sp.]
MANGHAAGASTGSLADRAIQAVVDHIRENRLRVGDTLPGEAYFSRSLCVSRAVTREAFGALAALKLIDVGNGRKPRVAALDGSVIATSVGHAVNTAQVSVAEVWDVRRTIEVRTASLAATARSDQEAAEILALAHAMAKDKDDLPRMTGHDIAFHEAIARACHNALFVQIVTSFAPLMQKAVPAAWRTRTSETGRVLMIERHQAVAQAIADRDEAAAARAMNAHFDASIGDLLKADTNGG